MHDHPCLGNRREFLKTAGALGVGLGLLPHWGFAREVKSPASADVGIARGSNMEEAVRRAVALAGGMDFIKEGQTVLIKPNVTGALKSPTTTNPEVLYAVIKLAAERGPKRIIVADRSFSPLFVDTTPKTIDVMKRVGHLDAVNQAKSDVKAPVVAVGLEDAPEELERLGRPKGTAHWRTIKPEGAKHWPNGFELAELLFAVDHVINVPVVKTHFQAWFTMSMKAFVGMSHHRSRREFHATFANNDLFDQKRLKSKRRRGIKEDPEAEAKEVYPLVARIAELNLGITPALNILDGSKSFVFGGPSNGDTAEPKLAIASRDRIAADATGVAVLKSIGTEDRLQNRSVWETPFLKHGIKIGLGIDSVAKLNLKQQGLDADIEKIRKMLV
ncbi:MAG TPA: DUF362 domain-containing protein [Gemmataceae bacterium]|jgi:uncharacterized protein (DUF362 family)|nr:DUF362 domain-containing protein [Gemmataceae bacterium]